MTNNSLHILLYKLYYASYSSTTYYTSFKEEINFFVST